MKRLTAFYSAILCSIIIFANNIEHNLVPMDCTIKGEIYTTVDTIALTFDCEESCSWYEFIHAYIYCDGIEVVSGMGIPDFEKPTQYADNIALIKIGGNSITGILPKGKSYQLHILPEVICNNDNGILRYNDNIYIDFTIPDNLGHGIPSINAGETIVSAETVTIEFPTEVTVADGTSLSLTHNGIREQTPVKADGNKVIAEFEETLYFDDGIEYTLSLPAGSVSAKYRDDIVNLETSINFIGGDKSGIENVETEKVSVTCINGLLTVSGISAGTKVAVFSVDGKAVANMITGSTAVEIPLSAKGIYIVTVDGKSYKIAN